MGKYKLTTDQYAELRDVGQVSIVRNGKKIVLTPLDRKYEFDWCDVPQIKKTGSLKSLYQCDYPVQPDDLDRAIAQRRLKLRDKMAGPRIGDYIVMPNGRMLRFAEKWPDGLQPTDREGSGSFHLSESGFTSMSGSLDRMIPNEKIVQTRKKMVGDFWIFHHGARQAHNAVGINAVCRVYRCKK